MPRGRKPKPTALKAVTGTTRANRANNAEPKIVAKIPDPPVFLSEHALEEWRVVSESLYRLGVLGETDKAALAAYCQAFGRWRQAEEQLAAHIEQRPENGFMIETSNGNLVQNPLVGIANKAMSDMMKFATEFGMTPSSRARLSIDAGNATGDPTDDYFF